MARPGTFQKGVSGNPGGRPKEHAEIVALARKASPEAIERLRYWAASNNPQASVAACNALLDRGFGRPSQMIDASPELTKLILAWAE